MTKQNVIDNVQASMASLFTKEDVIACINSIEQPAPATDYLTLLRLVQDRVAEMTTNFEWHDKSSVKIHDLEFSIFNGNRIELDEYTIDASRMQDNFMYELSALFDSLEEEHETRTEIVNNN